MLGREFVKRLTRIGLSAYVMSWCMTFTVCASDYPLSDMAVADSSIVAVAEDASAQVSSEDVTDVISEEPDDADTPAAPGNETLTDDAAASGTTEVTEAKEPAAEDAEAEETEPATEGISSEDAESATEVEIAPDKPEALLSANGTFAPADNISSVTAIGLSDREVIVRDDENEDLLMLEVDSCAPLGLWWLANNASNYDRLSWLVLDENYTRSSEFSSAVFIYNHEEIYCSVDLSGLNTSTTFYVKVTFNNNAPNPEDYPCDICKVEYIKTSKYGHVESINMSAHDLVVADKNLPIDIGIASYSPANMYFTYSNVTVSILDYRSNEVKVNWNNASIPQGLIKWTQNEKGFAFNISNLSDSAVFYVKFTYRDYYWYSSSDDLNSKPSDICRIQYVAPYDQEDIDISLPQSKVDVELFKNGTEIPITVHADFDDYRGGSLYSLGYDPSVYTQSNEVITDAWFVDSNVRDLFELIVTDGGILTVRLKDYIVGSCETIDEINKLVANKSYSSNVEFRTERSDGSYGRITCNTVLTLNIKRTLPVLKAGKMTFNPYLFDVNSTGYDILEPTISGATVTNLRINPAKPSGGFAVKNGRFIHATGAVSEKAKSGKISVLAKISPDEWRLPGAGEIAVDIPYALKNSVPSLKAVGSAKGEINPLLAMDESGFEIIAFNVSVSNDLIGEMEETDIVVEALDSKNKDASGVIGTYASPIGQGMSLITVGLKNASDSSTYGKTYKIKATPRNLLNGRQGTPVTLSVTVLSLKNAEKTSFSMSVKGDINALDPESATTVTITGKNVGFIASQIDQIKETLPNGYDVSDYFTTVDSSYQAGSLVFKLQANRMDNNFSLLMRGLDDQKIMVNVTVRFGTDKTQSLAKSFTIKRVAITPKLDVSKLVYNPSVDRDYNISYTLPGVHYRYGVNFSVYSGSTLLGSSIATTKLDGDGNCYGLAELYMPSLIPDASKYYGKTLDIRATPVSPVPRYIKELKPATVKLTVLDPSKSKPSISAKVKGSINCINDNTMVIATIDYKNVGYVRFSYSKEPSINSIYLATDKEKNDLRYNAFYYNYEWTNITQGRLLVYRRSGANLTAGSYKMEIRSPFDSTAVTTVTFKVTKGSVKPVLDKSTVSIVNDDTNRATFTVSTNDKKQNPVTRIEVADKNTKYNVVYLGKGKATIGFVNGSYCETDKKGKPITSAVTRKVKLNVYLEGSSSPATVTINVKVTPKQLH